LLQPFAISFARAVFQKVLLAPFLTARIPFFQTSKLCTELRPATQAITTLFLRGPLIIIVFDGNIFFGLLFFDGILEWLVLLLSELLNTILFLP